MNAEQSSTTQAMNESESNNSNPTDNLVDQTMLNGATASDQDTENVSETSSPKQKREERMKKFDIVSETKRRLEQARFERRRLELEMKMKKLETKHQLLKEELELERKVKRTDLENNDVRSRATSARDKSPSNSTPKKRDVSDRASRIYKLLTSDRSTTRFELTPNGNRHSHFSRYRSSRFPQSWSTKIKNWYASSSSLPKLKLNNFDGNPLEWPKQSSMFIATVVQRPISNSMKMGHVKTLLTGRARSAISGMGYSGEFYGAARSVPERKLERQMTRDHCPLADGTHKVWNCPLFRNMIVNDWYAAVRKQRLYYG